MCVCVGGGGGGGYVWDCRVTAEQSFNKSQAHEVRCKVFKIYVNIIFSPNSIE